MDVIRLKIIGRPTSEASTNVLVSYLIDDGVSFPFISSNSESICTRPILVPINPNRAPENILITYEPENAPIIFFSPRILN